MQVVSGSYQNYQNGAFSKQLTNCGQMRGDSESVDMCDRGVLCTLYTAQTNIDFAEIC